MYTCAGCGWRGESVSRYKGVNACSEHHAKIAWRNRRIKAKRAWEKEMRG
jgi:hypothetical protein